MKRLRRNQLGLNSSPLTSLAWSISAIRRENGRWSSEWDGRLMEKSKELISPPWSKCCPSRATSGEARQATGIRWPPGCLAVVRGFMEFIVFSFFL